MEKEFKTTSHYFIEYSSTSTPGKALYLHSLIFSNGLCASRVFLSFQFDPNFSTRKIFPLPPEKKPRWLIVALKHPPKLLNILPGDQDTFSHKRKTLAGNNFLFRTRWFIAQAFIESLDLVAEDCDAFRKCSFGFRIVFYAKHRVIVVTFYALVHCIEIYVIKYVCGSALARYQNRNTIFNARVILSRLGIVNILRRYIQKYIWIRKFHSNGVLLRDLLKLHAKPDSFFYCLGLFDVIKSFDIQKLSTVQY